MDCLVAPHMGAWIEMVKDKVRLELIRVAPHMGAWIEISKGEHQLSLIKKIVKHYADVNTEGL